MPRVLNVSLAALMAVGGLAAGSALGQTSRPADPPLQREQGPATRSLPDQSQAPSDAGRQGVQNRQGQQDREQFTRINVTTAASIVGQPVLDSAGDSLAEIEYLMIDPVTGRIDFAVLGRGGVLDLGESLIPVPWGHLAVAPGEDRSVARIALKSDAPPVEDAPRVSFDQLRQLTQPMFVTRVISFYGGDGRNAASAGSSAGTLGQADRRDGAGSGSGQDQASGPRTAEPMPDAQQRQRAGTQDAPMRQQQQRADQQSGQQAQAAGNSAVVVGRAFITTLGPPLVDWRSDIVGARVLGSDGREIGDIDHLVVDLERGHVVFAVIAQGGFLGYGEQYKAVPLQALT